MKKGAWANIPPKINRSDLICFSPYLYRARNQVERFFSLDRVVELVKETAPETGNGARRRTRSRSCGYHRSASFGSRRLDARNLRKCRRRCIFLGQEFSGPIAVPGLSVSFPFAPKFLREHKFTADVSQARDLVWKRSGSKQQIVADGLADQVVMILLALTSRANRGKVEMQYL